MFKLEIEPSETLHTKFGNANINNKGYYIITTYIKGNNMKLLHRLIWEKYYGEIPPNTHIHHVDGNKLNNCIWNLDALTHSEHSSLHNKCKKYSDETKMKMSEAKKGENHPFYNKHHSDETKSKMSKARNTTGYFRVSKHKCLDCKQGFIWCYQYYEDGKIKRITNVNIKKLEQKVKEKGLEWYKIGK